MFSLVENIKLHQQARMAIISLGNNDREVMTGLRKHVMTKFTRF